MREYSGPHFGRMRTLGDREPGQKQNKVKFISEQLLAEGVHIGKDAEIPEIEKEA